MPNGRSIGVSKIKYNEIGIGNWQRDREGKAVVFPQIVL